MWGHPPHPKRSWRGSNHNGFTQFCQGPQRTPSLTQETREPDLPLIGPLLPIQGGAEAQPMSPPHTWGGISHQPPAHPEVPLPGSSSAIILPLWQVAPPAGGDPHCPFMVYIFFSTSDLYNCKEQNPSFSEKPKGLISLLETVFHTHQPTWDDCFIHFGRERE